MSSVAILVNRHWRRGNKAFWHQAPLPVTFWGSRARAAPRPSAEAARAPVGQQSRSGKKQEGGRKTNTQAVC